MSLNHDKLKKTRAGARMGGGWRPKDGENRIRILPPHSKYLTNWEALENLAIEFKIHWFKIEGRPTEVSRCLEELNQKCPACAAWRAFRKSLDPGLAELAKSVGPSDQKLFNILDLSNLQAGVQAYTGNYTVWDKVMEIATNAAWGNVIDPANGVNFTITLTPGSRSRSGHNAYSVMPDPQRTNVMPVLQAIPGWEAQLDALGDQTTEAKTPEEITNILREMGFPITGGPGGGGGGGAPQPVVPVPVVPAPVAVPMAAPSVPMPVAAPVAVPPAVGVPAVPQPVAAPAPVPVVPGAVAPAVVPMAAPAPIVASPAPVASPPVQAGAHYDPGPSYTPKVPDGVRRADAPRCFSDYQPTVHRCQPCPVMVDCQLAHLGAA